MLSVVSTTTGNVFKKKVLKNDDYEVCIRTWIGQNNDDVPVIVFRPIGDIVYLPDITFANNEFILGFSNVVSIEKDNANKVVDAIKAAVKTCDEVQEFLREDKN